ncbi:glycoside hydrolase family 16 protein [Microbispora sp. H10885]|uniref:glycoside hydrolase family 16 protein n=1 Tax=Microbispora sp. H10885 TaxID=2729110 RepID=UPI00160277F5|nr:glycoside hydrolase family 16 protein [Microbispora sp. H10885]
MLIVAATACSSGDSTKVFNAGGESAARPPASSPDLPGSAPNAAGAGATRTSGPGAAGSGDEASTGDSASTGTSRTSSGASAEADGRSVHELGDEAAETAAEKIADEPVGLGDPAPSTGPAPRPSVVQRATPPPTAAPGARSTGKTTGKTSDETDHPMRPAQPAHTGPRQVDIVQPHDASDDPVITDRTGGTATGRRSSDDGTAAGWSGPVLTEDFGDQLDPSGWTATGSRGAGGIGGGALRLTGGTGLAGRLTQQYGRWEVRLRATEGSGTPVVSLRPGGGGAEIGLAAIGDPGRQAADAFVTVDGGDRTHGALRADFTRWHTVAVDWLPDRVSVWLDGARVWDHTGRVPAQRMGLSLRNVCEGSAACGGTLFVDWLRVYRAAQR